MSYINGGSECPGAKKSKDTEGMFWKRCDADIDTQTPEAEKANGNSNFLLNPISVKIERVNARALGAGKRRCTKRVTLRTQTLSARGGIQNFPAHFKRLRMVYIVSYVTGGEECSDAKPSKDVPGMFWKRCTLADEAEGTPVKPGVPDVVKGEEADHGIPSDKECKCKATWKWKKNMYKGCDPSHPEADRNWW